MRDVVEQCHVVDGYPCEADERSDVFQPVGQRDMEIFLVDVDLVGGEEYSHDEIDYSERNGEHPVASETSAVDELECPCDKGYDDGPHIAVLFAQRSDENGK